MSEITTTISELLATSRQIAESAQRVAQIAEETAARRAIRRRDRRPGPRVDRRDPPAGRPDRAAHAGAGQEVAADRRRARHRLRAGRADQHPRDQRHHRGGRRRRGGQAVRRRRRGDPQARRPRRRLGQGDPGADRRRARRGQHDGDGDRDRREGGRRRRPAVRRRRHLVPADRRAGRDHDRGRAGDRAVHQAADDRGRAGQRGGRRTSPRVDPGDRGERRRRPSRPRRSSPTLSSDLLRAGRQPGGAERPSGRGSAAGTSASRRASWSTSSARACSSWTSRPAPELVARLLRLAHTLKGAARVVKQQRDRRPRARVRGACSCRTGRRGRCRPTRCASCCGSTTDRSRTSRSNRGSPSAAGRLDAGAAAGPGGRAGAPIAEPSARRCAPTADELDELLDAIGEAHARLAPLRRPAGPLERAAPLGRDARRPAARRARAGGSTGRRGPPTHAPRRGAARALGAPR